MPILIIIYLCAAYWSVGKVLYANRVVIEFKPGAFFMRKMCLGAILGPILIPIAIIKTIKSG